MLRRSGFRGVAAAALGLFAFVVSVVLAPSSDGATKSTVKRRRVAIPTVVTYAIRVDADTGIDPAEAGQVAASTLQDPRSWGPVKRTRFQLTTWSRALLKIRVRTPRNTDRSCAPFPTGGERSCSRNWEVFINSDRWKYGAAPAGMPIDDYRRYVVNHEVGHSLGEDHRACGGPGQTAPVMLQQTIGLDGCLPNPWPNPSALGAPTTIAVPTTVAVPTVAVPTTSTPLA